MYYKKRRCCVCKSLRQDVILHKFPGDEQRCTKWLEYIGRDDLKSLTPVKIANLYVCQKHFEKRFITPALRLNMNAYPTLFTEDEILTGRASQQVGENYGFPAKEHSYTRKRHFDHTYSLEPLKEIQATASNSIKFPEQSSPQFTQTSQDSEVIASSTGNLQTLPQVPPNVPTNQDSENQATASNSIEFTEQSSPQRIQSSQDSEVIASNSCDLETLPQGTQNLPTNQDSEIQAATFTSCEFPERRLPEYTQINEDSEIQMVTFIPNEQCLPEYTQSSQDSEIQMVTFISNEQRLPEYTQSSQDSEIQAFTFTSGEFPERRLSEYTQISEDSEIQMVTFISNEQPLPEYTQSSQDSEIQAATFTSGEFPERRLSEYTQISEDSEIQMVTFIPNEQRLPEYTQSSQYSEIQAATFTSGEFPERRLPESTQISEDSEIQMVTFIPNEQRLPEYTQSSQDSECVKKKMINSDDQSIYGGILFKVADVEACRICLATDVKLFSLQDTPLGNCMKSIGGFSTSSCGGLPNFVCYECAPILLKCAKLIEKSKTAEATLLGIIAKNGMITKTLIEQKKISQPDLQSSLDSYLLLNYYHIEYDDDNQTSESIETETDPHINMEIDNSTIDNADGTIEVTDQDDNSVVEIQADIPMVEVESSDGESNEEYISLVVPHWSNENVIIEKCAKGIPNRLQHRPRTKKLWKTVRKALVEDFKDIQEHFITEKIPVNEQKQEWRNNMLTKCIDSGKEFICSVCQNTFQTVYLLNAHSYQHTSVQGGVRCDVCLVGFPNKPDLFYHTERIHAYRFKCKYCRMVLNNTDDAKYHIKFICNKSGIRRSRPLAPSSSNSPPTMDS